MSLVSPKSVRTLLAACARRDGTTDVLEHLQHREGDWWTIAWGYYATHEDLCRGFWMTANNHARRIGLHVLIGSLPVVSDYGNNESQGVFQYHSTNTPDDELPEGRYWGEKDRV